MNHFSIALVLLTLASIARGEDWPTYQHDAARSGVTSASIALPLAEQWAYRSAVAPKPAWPLPQQGWTELPKVDFDDAFYTVADKDAVYFGSSVDHQIHALDAITGTPRWSFFTGGPIRLAPTLAGGRVYFGSDDGKLYALQRADGTVAWTRDLAPEPRRVVGNGQVVSLWPIRTGVVAADGKVYCGAGIFPYHRVFAYALDAATGETVWKADALTTTGGFSPQGYSLIAGDRLIIPSGRAIPLFVNRANGQALFSAPPVTEKGGATGVYGTVVDDTLFIGTQNTLYGVDVNAGTGRGKFINADKLVATPESYFVLKGQPAPRYGRVVRAESNDVSCFNRKTLSEQPRRDEAGLKAARRWRFARPGLASLIVAGANVIAGGQDAVYVLDAATGEEVWSGKVSGLAVGLTVAHGRLIVSTTSGTIHCFAALPGRTANPAGESRRASENPKPAPGPADLPNRHATVATAIMRQLEHGKGFALLVGSQSVPLALELAKVSELKISCVALDADRVPALRRQVAAAGMYGHRITIESGTADALPFPDYAANLVVALDAPPTSKELLRVLKPCGGVLLAGGKTPLAADVVAVGKATADPQNGWTKLVRGELPGSGWWTHQYADAAGSGSSGDTRIKGKLDVLWFGEPGADRFPDRHLRGAAPLVMNGLVYCQGWNFLTKKTTVFCFDEYNGQQYWERDLEGAIRLGLPAVAGNFACDAESVYVVAGSQCHRLDARTGQTRNVYETPARADGTSPPWAYLSVGQGVVIGSTSFDAQPKFSDVVFAYDLYTSAMRWQFRGKEIRDTTLTLSPGKLIFADNRKGPPTKPTTILEPKVERPVIRTVVALDLATGKPAWEKDVDFTDCGHWHNASFGTLQALSKDDVAVFGGAYTIYYNPKDKENIPKRAALALSTKDGSQLWSTILANRSRPVIMGDALLGEPLFYNLKTGEKILKKQGTKMVPWTMGPRTGGCGSLSACESMVFGRGGVTVWRDVETGPGGAFIGTRPGCAINIIPAGGVVVQAEASSGCMCYQAIQCTVVMRPRDRE